MEQTIHRGCIFYVDRPQGGVGSEMRKPRPAIIVSNEKNNLFSQNIEVCYLTTAKKKKHLPTHVVVTLNGVESTILCENVYTISKERLGKYVATLHPRDMARVDQALRISLGLDDAPAEVLAYYKQRCSRLQAQMSAFRAASKTISKELGGPAT